MDQEDCALGVALMLTVLMVANYNTHRNNLIRHFQALHRLRIMKMRLVARWRRKRIALRAAAVVLAVSRSRHLARRQHRMWMKPRLGLWFETEVMEWWEDDRWLSNFRMKKASFLKLCDLVRGPMTPKINHVREPICLEARVAMCLYNLASCGEYRVTANQFGYHKTSVHRHLWKFIRAVTTCMNDYISMPGPEEAKEIALRWQRKFAFPQTFGAIDGTHIPMTAPLDGGRDYINRKGWASVILQAVCDDNYCFRSINSGAPGSWHDAAVLRDSVIYTNSDRLPKETVTIEGTPVNLLIVGDPAYPLLPWLMKAYPYHGAPAANMAERDSFNVYMNSGRMLIEGAFGRLKGRWRKLLKRNEIDHGQLTLLISTCCILHNFCESQGEQFYDTWLPDAESSRLFPQPPLMPHRGLVAGSSSQMRDAICAYLARHHPLRRSQLRP